MRPGSPPAGVKAPTLGRRRCRSPEVVRFVQPTSVARCGYLVRATPRRIAVDVRGAKPGASVGPEALPDADLAGRAVLFCFGWDEHWGTEAYYDYPHLSGAAVAELLERDAALVGVDTLNVDDHDDPARPAHSRLLAEDVLVVEHLVGVDAVLDDAFRFFAVPLKARGAAAMPVRAFAEVGRGAAER